MSIEWTRTLRELHEQSARENNANNTKTREAAATIDANDDANPDETINGQRCTNNNALRATLRQVVLVLLVGIVGANLLLLAYVLLMYFYGLRNKCGRGRRRVAAPMTPSTATITADDGDGARRDDASRNDSSSLTAEITSSVAITAGLASLLTSIPTLTAVILITRSIKAAD